MLNLNILPLEQGLIECLFPAESQFTPHLYSCLGIGEQGDTGFLEQRQHLGIA